MNTISDFNAMNIQSQGVRMSSILDPAVRDELDEGLNTNPLYEHIFAGLRAIYGDSDDLKNTIVYHYNPTAVRPLMDQLNDAQRTEIWQQVVSIASTLTVEMVRAMREDH